MLRLRPYNKNDAEIIMSWIKGENAFYKWTAGVLGEYPISCIWRILTAGFAEQNGRNAKLNGRITFDY